MPPIFIKIHHNNYPYVLNGVEVCGSGCPWKMRTFLASNNSVVYSDLWKMTPSCCIVNYSLNMASVAGISRSTSKLK